MIKANDFIKAATHPGLVGTPYNKMDCQALVEHLFIWCGEPHNWRGSNDMARNALSWSGTVAECEAQYAMIPPGAWVFVHKTDGGEKARGYTDGKGNFSHVGVYLGNGKVIESTTGGVQISAWPNKKWTHVGLAKDIDYTNGAMDSKEDTIQRLIQARSLIDNIIEGMRTRS